MMNQQLIMMGLIALGVFGFAYAFIFPYFDGDMQAEKRQKRIAKSREMALARAKPGAKSNKVADALKDIERREKGDTKLSLEDKLKQAGLDWSRRKYYMMSVILGLVLGAMGFVLTASPIFGMAGLMIGGLGMPSWVVSFLKKRRLKKFLHEFPNAVDIIVRGVKSGLPLGDCIRIIANEANEPVRTEFKAVIDQQQLGLSLPEAIALLPKRIPLQEATFFAIVVEIQSKSGGNLSEILGNLSKVLRDRKKMAGKIQAMSTEAKSSAGIIGALPFVVSGLIYATSPSYMTVLWTTQAGKITLIISAVTMAFGIGVMKKMINFDF